MDNNIKNSEKIAYFEPQEPAAGLFDKIIMAIKREQELRQTRNILFTFAAFFIISVLAMIFSSLSFISQMQNSGLSYFISVAISDVGTFLTLWKEFGLAIFESLPIAGLAVFTLSLAMSIFTVRLFFYFRNERTEV